MPKHFLWGLVLAKQYGTETFYAAVFNTTRKTFRKYSFKALHAIAGAASHVVR